jgi:hypothetical protein
MGAGKNGTVLGQKFWNGGWVPDDGYQNDAAYAGTNYNYWYPYILKFTAPELVGASEKVEMTLYVGDGNGASPTLRWALCSSDANKDLYRDTNGDVADPYQLASGTVTMENVASNNYQTITVKTSKIRSGETYYLFLWGYASPDNPQWITVYGANNHTAVIYGASGSVWVKTEEGLERCYAYNGRRKRLIPYVMTENGPKPTG